MKNKINKLLNLSYSQSQLLIKMFMLLTLVRLGLLLTSFKNLHKLLSKISHHPHKFEIQQSIYLEDIVWALDISTRYMPGGAKCLARALTSSVFMSRYGYTPQFRIGVAKDENKDFKAHAWVEIEGKVIVGNLPDLLDYKPMLSSTSNTKANCN